MRSIELFNSSSCRLAWHENMSDELISKWMKKSRKTRLVFFFSAIHLNDIWNMIRSLMVSTLNRHVFGKRMGQPWKCAFEIYQDGFRWNFREKWRYIFAENLLRWLEFVESLQWIASNQNRMAKLMELMRLRWGSLQNGSQTTWPTEETEKPLGIIN